MKRTGLINLICSLLAVVVVSVVVTLILIFSRTDNAEKINLVISSANATSIYDGKPLSDNSWKIAEGRLAKGDTLQVTVSGEQLNVGISENYVSAVVKDRYGNDVSEKYNITYKPGTLTVKSRPITVTAESDMKLYDGEELVADGYSVESSIALLPEHIIDVSVFGWIIDEGETDSVISSVTITDEDGIDVTRNYNIRKNKGKLTVYSADSIVIESASGQKYYDGKALRNESWSLLSGRLKEGHELMVSVNGAITAPGSAENSFTVHVFDSLGEDVTSEYSIVKIMGELNVISP